MDTADGEGGSCSYAVFALSGAIAAPRICAVGDKIAWGGLAPEPEARFATTFLPPRCTLPHMPRHSDCQHPGGVVAVGFGLLVKLYRAPTSILG